MGTRDVYRNLRWVRNVSYRLFVIRACRLLSLEAANKLGIDPKKKSIRQGLGDKRVL